MKKIQSNSEAIDPNFDDPQLLTELEELEKNYTKEEIEELKELYEINNDRVMKRSYLLNRLRGAKIMNEKDLINDNGFYKVDRFVEDCLLYCKLSATEHWLINYIQRNTFGKKWQSYVEINQHAIKRVYDVKQSTISKALTLLEKKNIIDVIRQKKVGVSGKGIVKHVRINTGVDTWQVGIDFKPMVEKYMNGEVIRSGKKKRKKSIKK